jgi:hypothetical protein
MNLASASAGTNHWRRLWAIWLAALCAAILVYGYVYHPHIVPSITASNVFYLAGYELLFALLIAVVFHFVVGRRLARSNRESWLAFVAIYVALIASGIIGGWQNERVASQAVAEIRNAYAPLVKNLRDGTMPSSVSVNANATATTEFGELQQVLAKTANKALAVRRDYTTELTAIGWHTVLAPDRIARDSQQTRGRLMVAQAGKIVRKYRAETDAVTRDARVALAGLSLSPTVKAATLANFDRSAASSRTIAHTYWGLEADVVAQTGAILDLLAARKGQWEVSDGHLLFARQADLDTFNGHIAAINADMAKEQAIHKKMAQRLQNSLDAMPRGSDQ